MNGFVPFPFTRALLNLSHQVRNPKGCKKVAGGRCEARPPGDVGTEFRTLKGCQTNSVTLSGSKMMDTRSPGYRAARSSPATLFQPSGLIEVIISVER